VPVRLVNREEGSGARRLLDQRLRAAGVESTQVHGYDRVVFSISKSRAIQGRHADVGIGIRSVRSCLISTLLTSCVLVVVTMADPCLREQALTDVAANFGPPFCEVALGSEMTTDHHVQVAVAPLEFLFLQSQRHTFDILFSADSERPKLLEEEGSGTTYVAGHLSLCSSTSDHIHEERPLSSKELRCRREIASSCALRSSLQEPVQ
jgi:hypothetical protein